MGGKLGLVQLYECAWVSRTNGTGADSLQGAAISRLQAFPLGGRCPSAHTGADEGAIIERFRSSQEGFRRLRAASDFARGGKVTKTPPGTRPMDYGSASLRLGP